MTTEELQNAAPTATSAASNVVDTRVLGKPQDFNGSSHDWKDWSTVIRAYTSIVKEGLKEAMEAAEASATPVLNAVISASAARLSLVLYYILMMLCKSTALDTVIVVSEGAGVSCA